MLFHTQIVKGVRVLVPAENQTPRSVVVSPDAKPLPRPTPRTYEADRSPFGPTSSWTTVPATRKPLTPYQEPASCRQAKATDPGCSPRREPARLDKTFNPKTDTTPIAQVYPYGRRDVYGTIPPTHSMPRVVTTRPSDMPGDPVISATAAKALRQAGPRHDWRIVK